MSFIDIKDKFDLKEIVFDNDVIEIPDSLFFGCYLLSSIKFNEGLKKIGNSAFANCISLKEIIFPDSLEFIGVEAFHRCINLESIVLPKNIKKISPLCFYRCTKLNTITLLNNDVDKVDLTAFDPIAVKTLKISKLSFSKDFTERCLAYFKNIYIETYA